jgi:hypothetical protein
MLQVLHPPLQVQQLPGCQLGCVRPCLAAPAQMGARQQQQQQRRRRPTPPLVCGALVSVLLHLETHPRAARLVEQHTCASSSPWACTQHGWFAAFASHAEGGRSQAAADPLALLLCGCRVQEPGAARGWCHRAHRRATSSSSSSSRQHPAAPQRPAAPWGHPTRPSSCRSPRSSGCRSSR